VSFITPDDRKILKDAAEAVAGEFGGRAPSPETEFRFSQENVTRYVELLDWEGRKVTVGVHLVADSPAQGDLVLTFWEGWDHWTPWHSGPSETDRYRDSGSLSYEPDGSQIPAMIADVAGELGYPPPEPPPEEWRPRR
jgi:hypothetical protein